MSQIYTNSLLLYFNRFLIKVNTDHGELIYGFTIITMMWLVGFLWHKIHKGYTAPDVFNLKGFKKKNSKIWMGFPIHI